MIDASVLATWFFEDEADARVDSIVSVMAPGKVCAPILLYFEIRNALVVGERRGWLTETQSAEYLRDLGRMRIRLEHPADDQTLMALARARGLTVYDAAYLDLAFREGLPLATLDRALQRAAEAEGVPLFQG